MILGGLPVMSLKIILQGISSGEIMRLTFNMFVSNFA